MIPFWFRSDTERAQILDDLDRWFYRFLLGYALYYLVLLAASLLFFGGLAAWILSRHP